MDLRDGEMVFMDEAIGRLLELYRARLEDNPLLVLKHWRKRVGVKARIEFYDDDYVLIIPDPGTPGRR
jgi:hypothetical protein